MKHPILAGRSPRTALAALAALALLVTLAGGLWTAADLGTLQDLAGLRTRLEGWQAQVQAHPLHSAAWFALAYVLVTAVSLPGATLLTLAGGALFGLAGGTALVLISATLGATLAMLSARYLLRDRLRQRWPQHSQRLDTLLHSQGNQALLSLRLLPAMPFFVLNLLMGLTPMPWRRYMLLSAVGMAPATLAYVNAGTALGSLHSLADVMTPRLWLSLLLLAALPWGASAAWRAWQRRLMLKPWARQRPLKFDRNLIVIGGGAAGLVSSYMAATLKASVTLVEANRMGGDCLNTGCVPSKALLRCAREARALREATRQGLTPAPAAPEPFARAMQQVRAAISAIEPHDSVARYSELGVDVRLGRATLIDPWRVAIHQTDGQQAVLSARAIVLATGAAPHWPSPEELPGLDQVQAHSSDTLWAHLATLDRPPARVVVLGGGAIACELAQALQGLGSQVSVVQRGDRLLSAQDPEVGAAITQHLREDGVQVLTGRRALRCERDPNAPGQEHTLWVSDPDGQTQGLPFDLLIVAQGRRPRWSDLGLETLGLLDAQGQLIQPGPLQTRMAHIGVAGDATGGRALTHLAGHHGWLAAFNGLFGDLYRLHPEERCVPQVIFTDPEVARVGLNVSEAQAQGLPHEVHRYELAELDRAITEGATAGWVQVLTPPGRDQILGVTIVGAHAGEMLAEFTLAMKHRLGLNALLTTIHPYPTWSEASQRVAGVWKRAHTPHQLMPLLAWFQRWRRG